MSFTEEFGDYVCDGDKITCQKDGFTVTATVEHDEFMGPPWKEHDGHGPVSDWRPKNSKRPGEKILTEDRGSCQFYDWQEAIKKAKADGWDAPPYKTGTKGQTAERAVQRDFEVLRAWCNDEWTWCSIVLSVFRNGEEVLENAASLYGIEMNYPGGDNSYLREVANQLLDEAIVAAEVRNAAMIKALSTPQTVE